MKKGAMFGLDARIALAIFGALSVISGAALYSAIQESRIVSFLSQVDEITKAHEAYILDVGSAPPLSGRTYEAYNLVENKEGVAGWNGPYLNDFTIKDSAPLGLYKGDVSYIIGNRPDTAWAGTDGVDSNWTGCSIALGSCYVFISLSITSKSFAEALDLRVDGSIDYKNGDVRVYSRNTGDDSKDFQVYVKTMISTDQPTS